MHMPVVTTMDTGGIIKYFLHIAWDRGALLRQGYTRQGTGLGGTVMHDVIKTRLWMDRTTPSLEM